MPASKDTATYADVVRIYERADAAPDGVKITFDDRQKALNCRQRLYGCRKAYREASKKIYPVGDYRHDTCAWLGYRIELKQEEDKYVIYLTKWEEIEYEVEDI